MMIMPSVPLEQPVNTTNYLELEGVSFSIGSLVVANFITFKFVIDMSDTLNCAFSNQQPCMRAKNTRAATSAAANRLNFFFLVSLVATAR